MEESSGLDLGWFFDQWVRRGGYPKLLVRQVYNQRKKLLTLTVSQVQTPDSLTPQAFVLPMNIEITTAQGKSVEPVRLAKRIESFSIKVSGRPAGIVLDSELKVPIKTVKYQKLAVVSR